MNLHFSWTSTVRPDDSRLDGCKSNGKTLALPTSVLRGSWRRGRQSRQHFHLRYSDCRGCPESLRGRQNGAQRQPSRICSKILSAAVERCLHSF